MAEGALPAVGCSVPTNWKKESGFVRTSFTSSAGKRDGYALDDWLGQRRSSQTEEASALRAELETNKVTKTWRQASTTGQR